MDVCGGGASLIMMWIGVTESRFQRPRLPRAVDPGPARPGLGGLGSPSLRRPGSARAAGQPGSDLNSPADSGLEQPAKQRRHGAVPMAPTGRLGRESEQHANTGRLRNFKSTVTLWMQVKITGCQ